MYAVVIDKEVYEKDFRRIDRHDQQRILKAIQRKLSMDPYAYGEPLRKELFGYWKLRVGEYRVIYRIKKNELVVLVVKVGPRKESLVYRGIIKRIRKL